jgi:uncharacterized membrane protein YbhN (UPF0104 family)
MLKQLAHRFEKSSLETFGDFMKIFLIALFIVFCFVLAFYLGILLIKNPVSLGIVCGTFLIIIIVKIFLKYKGKNTQ